MTAGFEIVGVGIGARKVLPEDSGFMERRDGRRNWGLEVMEVEAGMGSDTDTNTNTSSTEAASAVAAETKAAREVEVIEDTDTETTETETEVEEASAAAGVETTSSSPGVVESVTSVAAAPQQQEMPSPAPSQAPPAVVASSRPPSQHPQQQQVVVTGPRPAPAYRLVNAVIEKKEDGPGPRCGHTLTAVAAVGEEGAAGYVGPRLILFGGATALEGNSSAAAGPQTATAGAGIRKLLLLSSSSSSSSSSGNTLRNRRSLLPPLSTWIHSLARSTGGSWISWEQEIGRWWRPSLKSTRYFCIDGKSVGSSRDERTVRCFCHISWLELSLGHPCHSWGDDSPTAEAEWWKLMLRVLLVVQEEWSSAWTHLDLICDLLRHKFWVIAFKIFKQRPGKISTKAQKDYMNS